MKDKFTELCSRPDFREFICRIRQSANYHVAKDPGDEGPEWAILLCLAYAYEAGMKSIEK